MNNRYHGISKSCHQEKSVPCDTEPRWLQNDNSAACGAVVQGLHVVLKTVGAVCFLLYLCRVIVSFLAYDRQ